MICIVTPEALTSHFVTGEWDLAIVNQIPTVFLLFEDTALSHKYNGVQTIDYWNQSESVSLLRLREVLGKLAQVNPFGQNLQSEYLRVLYEQLSYQLGNNLAATLITYGTEQNRAAEPVQLTIDLSESLTRNVISKGVPLAAVLTGTKENLLLVGEEGSGKTVLLQQTARDVIVAKFIKPNSYPIPIYIDATLSKDKTSFDNNWLVAWLAKNNISAPIIDLILSSECLLLLDNIDHLAEEDLSFLFTNLPTKWRTIATSRDELDYFRRKVHRHDLIFFPCSGIINPISRKEDITKFVYNIPDFKENVPLSDERLIDVFGRPLMLYLLAMALAGKTVLDLQALYQLSDGEEVKNKAVELIVQDSLEKLIHQVFLESDMEFVLEDVFHLIEDFALGLNDADLSEYGTNAQYVLKYGLRFMSDANFAKRLDFSHQAFRNYFVMTALFGNNGQLKQQEVYPEVQGYCITFSFRLRVDSPVCLFYKETGTPSERPKKFVYLVLGAIRVELHRHGCSKQSIERVTVTGGYVKQFSRLSESVHLRRDRHSRQEPNLYRLVAVDRMTVNGFTLHYPLASNEDIDNIKHIAACLSGNLMVGRARNSGYGECYPHIEEMCIFKNGQITNRFGRDNLESGDLDTRIRACIIT